VIVLVGPLVLSNQLVDAHCSRRSYHLNTATTSGLHRLPYIANRSTTLASFERVRPRSQDPWKRLDIGLPVAPWGSSTIPTTVRIHGSHHCGQFPDSFHFSFQRALVPNVLDGINHRFRLDLT